MLSAVKAGGITEAENGEDTEGDFKRKGLHFAGPFTRSFL